MKCSLAIAALLFSTQGFAAQTVCTSKGSKAQATMMETSEGVEITLTENNFSSVGQVGRDVKFDGIIKSANTLILKKAKLDDVLNKSILGNAMFTLVLAMPDDGENDLAWSYASDLAAAMKCN